jgi:hypothetical protein
MDGMSRFLDYDKFSDSGPFIPVATLARGGLPTATPTRTATASPYWTIGSDGQPTTSGRGPNYVCTDTTLPLCSVL